MSESASAWASNVTELSPRSLKTPSDQSQSERNYSEVEESEHLPINLGGLHHIGPNEA